MCCVELESNLYLFGGLSYGPLGKPYNGDNHGLYTFPTDVFVLDLAAISINIRVVKGTPMNGGKASPHAFAAYGKIYALGIGTWSNLVPKFEVFNVD